MNVHKNARLTPLRREEMARDVVEGRLSKAHAARTYGVTGKIVTRWAETRPGSLNMSCTWRSSYQALNSASRPSTGLVRTAKTCLLIRSVLACLQTAVRRGLPRDPVQW